MAEINILMGVSLVAMRYIFRIPIKVISCEEGPRSGLLDCVSQTIIIFYFKNLLVHSTALLCVGIKLDLVDDKELGKSVPYLSPLIVI